MPTYEYRCQSCGHEMEATQRIVEPALRDCPACKQPALERLISRTSFQLKGGGWYKDLYSSNKTSERSENNRIDRLSKAVSDDKAKTEAKAESSSTSESSSTTSSTTTTSTTSTAST